MIDQSERDLRAIWRTLGISPERMEELLADITAKAQPGAKAGPRWGQGGAMVGPFKIQEEKNP